MTRSVSLAVVCVAVLGACSHPSPSPTDAGEVVDAGAARVPGAPTEVVAVAGNAQATVRWEPPLFDNGSPITGYAVTAASGGAVVVFTDGGTGTDVRGLTNGTTYTFTVHARSAVGTGPASNPSNPVTPRAPTAPADAGPPVLDAGSPDSGPVDVDAGPNPCDQGNGGCDPHAVCGFNGETESCTCETGYTGDGITCAPVVPDAGPVHDAGTEPRDAGEGHDAGPAPHDAGMSPHDAGTAPFDAGSVIDAGEIPDANEIPDASGIPDAGQDAGAGTPDAGCIGYEGFCFGTDRCCNGLTCAEDQESCLVPLGGSCASGLTCAYYHTYCDVDAGSICEQECLPFLGGCAVDAGPFGGGCCSGLTCSRGFCLPEYGNVCGNPDAGDSLLTEVAGGSIACAKGLACDLETNTCLAGGGASCGAASRCADGANCLENGTCCSAGREHCRETSDCCDGNTCQPIGTDGGMCVGLLGASCEEATQCASEICTDGSCSCSANGQPCSLESTCCTGNCGVVDDQLPYICLCVPESGTCTSDSQCCTGACTGGACACSPMHGVCSQSQDCCGGECEGGQCVSAFGGACSTNGDCASGSCQNGACACAAILGSCLSNSDCCNGGGSAVCSDDGECVHTVGESCTSANECVSGDCTDAGICTCFVDGAGCGSGSQCCSHICAMDAGFADGVPGRCTGGGSTGCVVKNPCTQDSDCCQWACVNGSCTGGI